MKSIQTYLSVVFIAGLFLFTCMTATGQVIPSPEHQDDFLVHFSIGWENSWRGQVDGDTAGNDVSEGWDAAWLFVKYRIGGGAWKHASLNEAGHIHPAGTALQPGLLDPASTHRRGENPIAGFFIYRGGSGFGDFMAEGVKLSLNYSENGLSHDTPFEIRLFAVEMEFIPGLGSADAVAPFYMMKHKITQQQFVDFLNTLPLEEQKLHTTASPFATEGSPAIQTGDEKCNDIQVLFPAYAMDSRTYPAEYMTSEPGETCTFISQESAMAFLEWSGQRTLSEEELEVAESWMLFRNERNKRLNKDIILSGGIDDNGLVAGYRGARSAAPAQSGQPNPTTRAQLTPPKR